MREIVVEPTKIKVKAFGTEQILSAPCCDEYFTYLDTLQERSKGSTQELMAYLDEYLESRGMDLEIAKKLELKTKQQIVKAINREDEDDQKKS